MVALTMPDEGSPEPADSLARGADEVVLIRPSRAGIVGSEELLAILHEAVLFRNPAIILLGATPIGNEVAARLAHRLGRAAATGCTGLRLDGDGHFVVERPVYGGRFVAEQELSLTPCIATVQPRRFDAPLPEEGQRGEITDLSVDLPTPRVQVLFAVEHEQNPGGDITSAEVLVAAGRGVGKRDDLPIVESLAHALGGTLAASRPLTDDLKWLHPDCKVGLSGQTVKPRLYVACGISGQIEHVVGMRPSRTVVAINSDPNARIHFESDYSVVADLHEFIPALIHAIEAAKPTSD